MANFFEKPNMANERLGVNDKKECLTVSIKRANFSLSTR
jgi:hypothetical protein